MIGRKSIFAAKRIQKRKEVIFSSEENASALYIYCVFLKIENNFPKIFVIFHIVYFKIIEINMNIEFETVRIKRNQELMGPTKYQSTCPSIIAYKY